MTRSEAKRLWWAARTSEQRSEIGRMMNPKGSQTGHTFRGRREWTEEQKLKLKGRISHSSRPYLNMTCMNCTKFFQTREPKRKFCSKPCSGQYIGKNIWGKSGIGRTPAEGSGRCKWYEYASPIAGKVKVQGTWELRAAHCLDADGKLWRTNHNRDHFSYTDLSGKTKTYAPDFWQDGIYIEIKGYTDAACAHKLLVVSEMVPLKVIRKNDLIEWERKYEY